MPIILHSLKKKKLLAGLTNKIIFRSGNFPGGNIPRWAIFPVAIFQVAIDPVAIFPVAIFLAPSISNET